MPRTYSGAFCMLVAHSSRIWKMHASCDTLSFQIRGRLWQLSAKPAFDASPIAVRRAIPDDAAACGRICYEAFRKISTEHAFPPDFPSVDVPTGVLSMMFSHPGFYCVVAESGGEIVGSNCLDERSSIAGVGPITIDPAVQNKGIGRALMEAVLTRSAERGFPGIRLLTSGLSQPFSIALHEARVRHPRADIHNARPACQGPDSRL